LHHHRQTLKQKRTFRVIAAIIITRSLATAQIARVGGHYTV